jgi:DNA polymerase V
VKEETLLLIDKYKIYRQILIIDLKSFYASVECSLRGLDPFTTPIVVADKSRGGGSVVLSVSPYLKTLGVPNVCRIMDLPKDIDIIYAKPRMHLYLEFSTKILEIFLSFISEQDIHVYSVDESFLDVTDYLKMYKMSAEELGYQIQKEIHDQLHLYSACGIGSNMLLAKLALDIEAKKTKNLMSRWTYEDIERKLWPIEDLTKMWSIGRNMDVNLRRLGVNKIGDIPNLGYAKLKREFGILGLELFFHCHGIDQSMINQKNAFRTKSKSVGNGQVLFKDYYCPEIKQIILEMVDVTVSRLRLLKQKCRTITLGIRYSKEISGGFMRQCTLGFGLSSAVKIFEVVLDIFNKFYDGESPIRMVNISLSKLEDDTTKELTIFDDFNLMIKEELTYKVMDEIKEKFGANAVYRASSQQKHSTLLKRNEMIGGHNA